MLQQSRAVLNPFDSIHDKTAEVWEKLETVAASSCSNHQAVFSRDKVYHEVVVKRVRVPAEARLHGTRSKLRNELVHESPDDVCCLLRELSRRLFRPACNGNASDCAICLGLGVGVLCSPVSDLDAALGVSCKAIEAPCCAVTNFISIVVSSVKLTVDV